MYRWAGIDFQLSLFIIKAYPEISLCDWTCIKFDFVDKVPSQNKDGNGVLWPLVNGVLYTYTLYRWLSARLLTHWSYYSLAQSHPCIENLMPCAQQKQLLHGENGNLKWTVLLWCILFHFVLFCTPNYAQYSCSWAMHEISQYLNLVLL